MGHTIPTQHPAVVLRSHYDQVRALLAAALIAIVGLTVAVVILATNDHAPSASSAPVPTAAEFRLPSHARIHGGAPVPDLSVSGRDVRVAPGTRYDGGPDEGTRGPAR
jgi:hypothetical protein